MATLQVRWPDSSSATRQKALEDAKKMQATVKEQSAKDGKDAPPYLLDELIGKGSFGRVYKATDTKSQMMVAVKIIDIEESDTANPKFADTFREFMAEVNTLKLLSNIGARNINHVIEALPVGQSMWMVTEYCAGGSVATLMKPTAPGGLQERWIIPILREVAEAIYWVHREGIIHRDIKCANVLITEDGGVQLCDFGVAGIIETKFDKRSTFIGTPHWMAPELFDENKSYGTEVDIWAFGSLVYEIASGLPPNVMAGLDIYSLGKHIKSHAPRLDGDQYSPQLRDLAAYCLVEDPKQRPSIEEVQAHPYIKNTAQSLPSSSLSLLVRGYKMWESQGGARKSLFAPGGAQPPSDISDFSSTALANDEWNFSTTLAFDQEVFQDTDSQAVFDVYGSNVDFDPSETQRPKPKSRRRPPPQVLAAMKAPLEKVFDPNTISNYEDNSRAYYGRPPVPPPAAEPPPASDLPLRDDTGPSADVRESLIDLDASLQGSDLSQFVDMNTIRAGDSRASVEYGDSDYHDYNNAPLSDPADLNPNRRTRDWKFPSMAPPASANPEMSRFPFSESNQPASRPGLPHHPTDPVAAPNHGGNASVTEPQFQPGNRESASSLIDLDMSTPEPQLQIPPSRESVNSLIDLDMGLADPAPDLTRPSTANSDAASMSGSELGIANPFALERHASLYVPSSNREPSIYVSDNSDFASAVPKANDDLNNGLAGLAINEGPRPDSSMSTSRHVRSIGNGSIGSSFGGSSTGSGSVMADTPPQQQQQHHHQQQQPLHLDTYSFNPSDFADEPEEASAYTETPQNPRPTLGIPSSATTTTSEAPPGNMNNLPLPLPLPTAPPSLHVMQGQADASAVKDELRRMTQSLGEHLTYMNQYLSMMPESRNSTAAFDGPEGLRRF